MTRKSGGFRSSPPSMALPYTGYDLRFSAHSPPQILQNYIGQSKSGCLYADFRFAGLAKIAPDWLFSRSITLRHPHMSGQIVGSTQAPFLITSSHRGGLRGVQLSPYSMGAVTNCPLLIDANGKGVGRQADARNREPDRRAGHACRASG